MWANWNFSRISGILAGHRCTGVHQEGSVGLDSDGGADRRVFARVSESWNMSERREVEAHNTAIKNIQRTGWYRNPPTYKSLVS
jgi:hypothetical protein